MPVLPIRPAGPQPAGTLTLDVILGLSAAVTVTVASASWHTVVPGPSHSRQRAPSQHRGSPAWLSARAGGKPSSSAAVADSSCGWAPEAGKSLLNLRVSDSLSRCKAVLHEHRKGRRDRHQQNILCECLLTSGRLGP